MNNQNKKILLIITKSNFGGAQKYVLETAKELRKRGFDVHVALGGSGILIDKLKQENIIVEQIKCLGRDVSVFDDIKTFFALLKIISTFKPHIVHLNSSKIGGIGALASRLLFVPRIIFTIHGWAFNEERGSLSKQVIRLVYSITIFLSHASIAVSKQTKNQAVGLPFYSILKNKITVVTNGISAPDFVTREESRKFISEQIKKPIDTQIVIGQIAELHPIKSIETTIEAARQLLKKNTNLIFIIMGDGEQRGKLRFLIDTYNLNDSVFLLGFVDNAAQYIKGFDVFCLTSKSEALALVLLEAGYAQVPVIASRVGGIPELITEDAGFLFESQNTEDFIEQVEKVLSLSIEQKEKYITNFYTKIQTEFSITHMTDKTIAVYEK